MITCPLCGTEQPNAWDCSACGHPLHERPALHVDVAALAELEPTRRADAGNVGVELLPGLETTSVGPVEAPDAPLLEIEATCLPDVHAAGETLPGLETTALEPPAEPTPQAQVSCRTCGTPWQPAWGIFCPRCGKRVPAVRAAPRPEVVQEARACPSCGTPRQRIGDPCTGCGQKVVAAALA